MYQDNQSTIRIENNGWQSISLEKRYINTRYSVITDIITKEEASVEFCTTLEIIGEYFKKALHGYQFCCIYNIIIGIHEYDIPSYNAPGRSFLEEQR